MKVRGFIKDLKTFKAITANRVARMQAAPAVPVKNDRIRDLASALHPERLYLIVDEVRQETPSTRTFRLKPADEKALPPFRAGQYISIKAEIDGCPITRPYSISSTPNPDYYEISIRIKEGGLFSTYAWEKWQPGQFVEASGPHGLFHYERLRDTQEIVALAGGSGITPFKSMLGDIASGRIDARMTLLYGSRNAADIVFYDELSALEKQAPEKIRIVHVLSEATNEWQGERGFLDAACIRRNVENPQDKTFFICGPQVMYNFLDGVLDELQIKRVRREVFGEALDITSQPGYPDAPADRVQIHVMAGEQSMVIEACTKESVLVALERAGIAHDSQCRSGECAFCRSQLLAGEIFVNPENDGRRLADKYSGYFHPCSSYPLSDLEMRVPIPRPED